MSGALLGDRGVVEVGGLEAGEFLQRLITNDVLDLAAGAARYGALLTPQGKILVDFLAVRMADGFRIDCPLALAPELVRKLMLYRLRAKVTIADRSGALAVAAFWPEPDAAGLAFADPRHPGLGWRLIAEPAACRAALAGQADDYQRQRILAGVPQGGLDFPYGETFPHEASLDRLHGVDFGKGCYVGQEVVSRVEHRGTARKRILAVRFDGAPPPAGSDVLVGESVIGRMGSSTEGHGLALLRTDRLAEAAAAGLPVSAAGVALAVAPA